MTDWKVTIIKGGTIQIVHETYGHYGFHPLDLSIDDRMKMIRALSMTKEDQMMEMFGHRQIDDDIISEVWP